MCRAQLENTAGCYAIVYVCIYSTNDVLYLTLIVYRLTDLLYNAVLH